MKSENIVSDIYELFSKAILLYFLAFLLLLIVFISLDVLNTVLPNKEYLLKYAEIFGSFILIVVTAKYASDNNRMVKLSRNTQEVMYIQTRLEKLYYPLKIVLNQHQINKQTILSENWISSFKTDMNQIIPYLYLSSDLLNPLLNRFIKIFYKNGTLTAAKATKELEDKMQNSRQNKEMTEPDLFEISIPYISPTSWELITKSEIEEAITLYTDILKRIDEDVLEYQTILNELTISKRTND